MNRTIRSAAPIVLPLLVASLAGFASAANEPLLPPAAGDLVATSIEAAPAKAAGPQVSQDPVTFSWALDRAAELEPRPEPATAVSRQYWLRVTAADLEKGVALPTTAPGAVVRLNPAGDAAVSRAPEPATLVLVAPDGATLEAGDGMELLADDAALKSAGAPFVDGTVAFRIRTDLGAGRFVLRTPRRVAPSETPFIVHVHEPSSSVALGLRAERTDVLAGHPVAAVLRLTDGSATVAADRVAAALVAPNGRRSPARVRSSDDGARIVTAVPTAGDASHGLWEIEVTAVAAVDGLEVRRDVRTAFSTAIPSARLGAVADIARAADGSVAIRLPVEAASEGRYEVRGTLYGTSPDGRLVPAAISHSADWFPVGNGVLELRFGGEFTSGLAAPFELRDLQLVDQGRMGVLHRQARGLVIE